MPMKWWFPTQNRRKKQRYRYPIDFIGEFFHSAPGSPLRLCDPVLPTFAALHHVAAAHIRGTLKTLTRKLITP
jgi:hypothetical protein